jgi:hypothetical protein
MAIKLMQRINERRLAKLLFIVEAQLFHGLTRREAVMLWNDGIDTLYDTVSEEHL